MDLNRLSVFVKVVDKGSFTKAADALRQPKSRVSRHIAALERDLGVPLLYRSTRQFSLTEAGRALYSDVRDHVYALEGATDSLATDPKQIAGLLKLTAAEDLGSTLLGPFVAALTKKFPELVLQLHFSNELVDLVKEGMDLAIRIDELEDTTLRARKIGTIAFGIVAAPAYLKRAPVIRKLEDLAYHPALSFSTLTEGDVWHLVRQDKSRRTVRVQPRCRSNNPKSLLDIALSGQGVALLPEFLCFEALRSKALVRLLPEYSTRPVPVHFVWPAQRGRNPKLHACVDFGVEYLARFLN